MSGTVEHFAPVPGWSRPLSAYWIDSFTFLLVLRSGPAPSIELCGKPIQPGLPHRPVAHPPIVQFLERLRAEGVESAPALRADGHESSLLQNGELPRDPARADVHHIDP